MLSPPGGRRKGAEPPELAEGLGWTRDVGTLFTGPRGEAVTLLRPARQCDSHTVSGSRSTAFRIQGEAESPCARGGLSTPDDCKYVGRKDLKRRFPHWIQVPKCVPPTWSCGGWDTGRSGGRGKRTARVYFVRHLGGCFGVR